MQLMLQAIETLSVAYSLSGLPRYAERAAMLVRTWFSIPVRG